MKTSTYQMTIDNGALTITDEQGNTIGAADLVSSAHTRVFALYGNLGAGKTTLIKSICQQLQVEDVVNSPTFAIVNTYSTPQGEPIYHFDCYRLKNLAEAIDIGIEEYIYSGNLCLIEWPEVIEPILPEDTVLVHIKACADYREIIVEEP